MVDLAYQCMWLLCAPLKYFTATFFLSFESSHSFKLLTIESRKMTVTLSYSLLVAELFLEVDYRICLIFFCARISFTTVDFVWLGILCWFHIILVLLPFSISSFFDSSCYHSAMDQIQDRNAIDQTLLLTCCLSICFRCCFESSFRTIHCHELFAPWSYPKRMSNIALYAQVLLEMLIRLPLRRTSTCWNKEGRR